MTELRREARSFVRDGDRVDGVSVWSEQATPLPGIVLIPDVHGVSPLYERLAERFARAGLFVFVINLYSREGAPKLADLAAIQAWIARLDDRRVLEDLTAAAAFVATQPEVVNRPVGITGFCLGGQYALMAACRVAGLGAAVSFYGMIRGAERSTQKPESPLEAAPALSCPYLGLFGAEDPLIPLADVRELEATLDRHGKAFSIHVYPGAGHAFCNDERPEAHRPEAANDALVRATDHFRRYLSGVPGHA